MKQYYFRNKSCGHICKSTSFLLDDEDPFLDVLWYETVGKMKNLTKQTMDQWSGVKTQVVFQIKQTNKLYIWAQNRSKKWARISIHPGNIEANGSKIIYQLRVSLLHITPTSKILRFTTCNCCISILFELPNHSRCLTFLASVVAAFVSVAVMEVSLLPTAQPMQTSKCHWPHSVTNQRVAELIFGGSRKKTNKKTMIT